MVFDAIYDTFAKIVDSKMKDKNVDDEIFGDMVLGLLNRIRLSKSVIITMTVQTSQSTESCNGQKKLNLAEQLREALSDWIIGKVSLDEIGIKCEQLVRRSCTFGYQACS